MSTGTNSVPDAIVHILSGFVNKSLALFPAVCKINLFYMVPKYLGTEYRRPPILRLYSLRLECQFRL